MGMIDRAIRVLFAVIIATAYFTNTISGTFAIILLAFASIFIITSLVGSCPLYMPIRLSTRKKEKTI